MEPVKDFHHIENLVKAQTKSPRKVMVVGNCFVKWMRALKKAKDENLVEPILLGSEAAIRENADIHDIDIRGFDIRNTPGGSVTVSYTHLRAHET